MNITVMTMSTVSPANEDKLYVGNTPVIDYKERVFDDGVEIRLIAPELNPDETDSTVTYGEFMEFLKSLQVDYTIDPFDLPIVFEENGVNFSKVSKKDTIITFEC